MWTIEPLDDLDTDQAMMICQGYSFQKVPAFIVVEDGKHEPFNGLVVSRELAQTICNILNEESTDALPNAS